MKSPELSILPSYLHHSIIYFLLFFFVSEILSTQIKIYLMIEVDDEYRALNAVWTSTEVSHFYSYYFHFVNKSTEAQRG